MLAEIKLFRNEVPQDVLRAVLRATFRGHREAWEKAQVYGLERIKDTLPALRRFEVEKQIQFALLGPGVDISLGKTTSATYLMIQTGKVVLTTMTRKDEVRYIRPARYRETLATPVQRELFDEFVPKSVSDKLYGLLLHGGDHSERPGLVEVVFPLPDGSLLDQRINLLAEFPDVKKEFEQEPVPALIAEPGIKLKHSRVKEEVS